MNIDRIQKSWLSYREIMGVSKRQSKALNRAAHSAFLCGALAGALATRNAAEETAHEITSLIGAQEWAKRKGTHHGKSRLARK
jgi:hypothetical protein